MYSREAAKIKLFVVDIENYKIMKEIASPHIYFMIFFEE
jgi:hypothetical protein